MVRLAIALGGAAGAVARHATGTSLVMVAGPAFPWGTLAVNVAGSWLLGVLMQVLGSRSSSPALRAALTVGFCAGFTTFSTFAYETVMLARTGQPEVAAAYVGLSLVLGMAGMMAGIETGAALVRRRRTGPEGLGAATAVRGQGGREDAR